MTEHEELHLLSGAYAVDALDDSEKERFETYLLTSEEARAEVASLSDTAVSFAMATEPVAPPADLKARLMAQIAITPQNAPLVKPRPVLAAVPSISDVAKPQDAPETAERVSPTATRPLSPAERKAATRWYVRPTSILIAAAAAVALFVGGNVLGLSSAPHSSQQASALSSIVSAADFQAATAGLAGGGSATFVWSADQRKSAVVLKQLPALPSGKTYELWFIDTKSNATPAGIFSPSTTGSTVKVFDGKMTGGDTFGITVEPSGGSKQPTTTPIVAVASV